MIWSVLKISSFIYFKKLKVEEQNEIIESINLVATEKPKVEKNNQVYCKIRNQINTFLTGIELP
jgi:hypothetical protein